MKSCPTCGALLIFSAAATNRLCRACLAKLNAFLRAPHPWRPEELQRHFVERRENSKRAV